MILGIKASSGSDNQVDQVSVSLGIKKQKEDTCSSIPGGNLTANEKTAFQIEENTILLGYKTYCR